MKELDPDDSVLFSSYSSEVQQQNNYYVPILCDTLYLA